MRKNINVSEVITINADVNECCIAFSFELLHHLSNSAKMLFITANNIKTVHENIEQVKEYIPDFGKLHSLTNYLFLKEEWTQVYEKYGVKTFNNELISIAQNNEYNLYYFHRIDLFFDKYFNHEIRKALFSFIEIIRYNHKKVIFSYNNKTASGKEFENFLKRKNDLSFNVRPNDDNNCNFTMKTYSNLFKKEYAKISLISNNEEIINMHKTVFNKQKMIHFNNLSLNDLQNPKQISFKDSDIIIYNDSRKPLDLKMIKAFKKFAPYSKIFSLSSRKFIRQADIIESKEAGVDLLLPKSFDIKEYIHAIESEIHDEFYTPKLKNLSFLNKNQQVDIKELLERIAELEENRIFFCIVTVRATDIEIDNISSMIRREDFVFTDHTNNIILFVMVNLLPDIARDIIAKRTSISKLLIKHQKKDAIAELIG